MERADAKTDDDALGDAVRLMTMHRAKCLEYRAMVLARVSSDQIPPAWVGSMSDEDQDLELRKERNLVYVARLACTRASVCVLEWGAVAAIAIVTSATKAVDDRAHASMLPPPRCDERATSLIEPDPVCTDVRR